MSYNPKEEKPVLLRNAYHRKIKSFAKAEGRTIQKSLEIMIDKFFNSTALTDMENGNETREVLVPRQKTREVSRLQVGTLPESGSTPEDSSRSGEKPCCSKAKPCQHWAWDGAASAWVNGLSGRSRDV